LLLVAGVQYLLVRSRKIRVFGGLPLDKDAGWQSLKASLRAAAVPLFDAGSTSRRRPRPPAR
jgi:hypothetical protein